ncbi:MAG: hypothetical protein M3O22_00385 [Pseudomonadota bacterium]|nr:hypothetical protein [Pseudomonadota bacterium]
MAYETEIQKLEEAARHISGCAMTTPCGGSDMELEAISLRNHAEVLRAANGDRRAQQNGGYDWDEPGRLDRALAAYENIKNY